MGEIKVLEKPANVSWDDVRDAVFAAHAENRSKGIVMKLPGLPGDEIRAFIERGNGKLFVAMDGERVIGTSAVRVKKVNDWFYNGDTAYLCFVSVLPEYSGKGVYRKLSDAKDEYIEELGFRTVMADTHEKNMRILGILEKQGYKRVGIKKYDDHFNVIMFNWTDGCPYGSFRLCLGYLLSVAKEKYLRPLKNALKKLL